MDPLSIASEDLATGRSRTKSEDRRTLHDAAREGDLSTCKYLIESTGAQVNACTTGWRKETPLHFSAESGHIDVCKYLIENGADGLLKDWFEQQPIHYAAKGGHVSVCEYLVKSAEANVNARDASQMQPLHFSAESGHIDVCKYLIENGADGLSEDWDERQPIHYAAKGGLLSICEYLVKSAGANVNARDEYQMQPLYFSAESGHVDVCRYLIENGADGLSEDRFERQPIHYAAKGGLLSICDYLVKSAGANVNARDENQEQPLHFSAESGHVDVCKYLIESGADAFSEGRGKQQPIHYAASGGHVSVCEYLIESAGAHVNASDEHGNCPLHAAVAGGRKDVCRFLLEINSNLLKVRNGNGEEAVHVAYKTVGGGGVFSYLLSLYTDADLNQGTGLKLLQIVSKQRRVFHPSMVCSFLSRRCVDSNLIDRHSKILGIACLCETDKENLSYVFSCISEEHDKIDALKVWLTKAAGYKKFLHWLIYEGCKDDSGKAAERRHSSAYDILWSSEARKDFLLSSLSVKRLQNFWNLSNRQSEMTRSEKASAKTVHKSLCRNPASHQSKTAMLRKFLSIQRDQQWEDDHDFSTNNTRALEAYLIHLSEKKNTFKKSEDILSLCLELVRSGADVHVTDEEQKSLLHYAASDGREEICRSLLEIGANPLAKDASGKLSWEMAFSSGHEELSKYLRKVGSIPEEILAEGGDAVNIYLSAFRDGAASCTFFRVDVVGKDGTGKTSLIKSLTRQKFNLKEPSTEGVETACEVVVKETCNWAKIVEIRERKRVYNKAAAASVAKRLKETNPSLGGDIFSSQANDEVSVIDKLSVGTDDLDEDQMLASVVLFLSEKYKEAQARCSQEGVFSGGTGVTAASSPEPQSPAHCLPARTYSPPISVEISLRRDFCTADLDKANDEDQLSGVSDDLDDDNCTGGVSSCLSDKMKEERRLLPTAGPPSPSSAEMLKLPTSKERNQNDSAEIQLHHYSDEEHAHNSDQSRRSEEHSDESERPLPHTRKSDDVSLPSPSRGAHLDVDSSNNLPASVEALTKVYLADPAALNQASSDIYIDLLDYGGQHIYYTTHFSFLNKEAIYFVVFDVSLPLDERAKSTFRCPGGENEEIAVHSVETNYDRLEEWLSSICVMEPPAQPSLPTDGQVDRQPPYIFLVATHRDKLGCRKTEVQKFLKDQNDYLKNKLKGKDFSSHIIPASHDLLFYAVDNTKSSSAKKAKRDPSVIALEKGVEDFAKKLARRIPLRWLKFEVYVRNLRTKNPDEKVVSIDALRQAAREEANVLDDDEFKILIRFLTNRAVLLYHPLPGVTDRSAVVDVQWLARVFQKVVTVHMRSKTPLAYHDDLERAKCKGIVTSLYLSYLLSNYSDYQKEIKDLLIFFDIICPYQILQKAGDAASDDDDNERDYVCLSSTDDDSRRSFLSEGPVVAYFVPCLLTIDEKMSCAGSAAAEPLVLFSKNYRIPQTLFYRIMTRLARRFGRCPRLHPSLGYFVVYHDHRLEIRLYKYSISFTVFPIRGDKVVSQVCSRVREFVVAAANDCKKSGMAGLELHLGCLAGDSSRVEDESFVSVEQIQSDSLEASEYSEEVISFWHPKPDAVVKFLGSTRRRPQGSPSSFEATFGPVAAIGTNAVVHDNKSIRVNNVKIVIADTPEALQSAERIQTTIKGILSADEGAVTRESSFNNKSFTWETSVADLVGRELHSCLIEVSNHLDSTDNCGDDWRRLARQLLEESDEKIKFLEQAQKEQSPAIGVLKKWVQESEPHEATVRALANALTIIYRTDAALSVCKFVEQPSGGPILNLRKIVARIVTDEEKSQELASALGVKFKASFSADSIILSWMKYYLAEATVEALLQACREIGILEEVQAAAARKKVTLPSFSMATEENRESSESRKRRQSGENLLAKRLACGGAQTDS